VQGPGGTITPRPGLRILVAEDNVVNQKVMLKLLERLGYRADLVQNGREAVDAVGQRPYDVILMDVMMPELDGLEATRIICERWPRERRPRIIAATANAMESDRRRCEAAGMDDFISKPVRVEDLQSALSRCGMGGDGPGPQHA
jgi:CheY-like chemotaxis protein